MAKQETRPSSHADLRDPKTYDGMVLCCVDRFHNRWFAQPAQLGLKVMPSRPRHLPHNLERSTLQKMSAERRGIFVSFYSRQSCVAAQRKKQDRPCND
jgi:hypothetical protein